MSKERFILQESELKENFFVCTDTTNLLICVFENHNYNDNQEFSFVSEPPTLNPSVLATLAREMGNWLRDNHYDKIF